MTHLENRDRVGLVDGALTLLGWPSWSEVCRLKEENLQLTAQLAALHSELASQKNEFLSSRQEIAGVRSKQEEAERALQASQVEHEMDLSLLKAQMESKEKEYGKLAWVIGRLARLLDYHHEDISYHHPDERREVRAALQEYFDLNLPEPKPPEPEPST